MAGYKVVDWETITAFMTEAFVRYGVPEADAKIFWEEPLQEARLG